MICNLVYSIWGLLWLELWTQTVSTICMYVCVPQKTIWDLYLSFLSSHYVISLSFFFPPNISHCIKNIMKINFLTVYIFLYSFVLYIVKNGMEMGMDTSVVFS